MNIAEYLFSNALLGGGGGGGSVNYCDVTIVNNSANPVAVVTYDITNGKFALNKKIIANGSSDTVKIGGWTLDEKVDGDVTNSFWGASDFILIGRNFSTHPAMTVSANCEFEALSFDFPIPTNNYITLHFLTSDEKRFWNPQLISLSAVDMVSPGNISKVDTPTITIT